MDVPRSDTCLAEDEHKRAFQSSDTGPQHHFDYPPRSEYPASDQYGLRYEFEVADNGVPDPIHALVDNKHRDPSHADSSLRSRPPASGTPSHTPQTRKLGSYPWVASNVRYEIGVNVPAKPWDFRKFQAKSWLKTHAEFSKVTKSRGDLSGSALRVMRLHILQDTVEACIRLEHPRAKYFRSLIEQTKSLTSEVVEFEQLKEKLAELTSTFPVLPSSPELLGRIRILNADSLDAGMACSTAGFESCVLNMGHPCHRGGGVKTGAAAQEESLFRRTNLYYRLGSLEDALQLESSVDSSGANAELSSLRSPSQAASPFMNLTDSAYTAKAIVFRKSEAKGYEWMSKLAFVDVLTSCALDRKQSRGIPYTLAEESQMGDIIESILYRALVEGKNCIVLGAFGCGAFNNPPQQVAAIFRKKLIDEGFARFFRLVVFAIIEDANSGGKNLSSFSNVFGLQQRSLSDFESEHKIKKKSKWPFSS